MSGPEGYGTWENGEAENTGEGYRYNFTGETDRETGEYHYKSEPIYSDAHYVPAGESTAPPQYYTPPEKSAREPKHSRPAQKKKSGRLVGIFCICLVCALIGGNVGANLVGGRLTKRVQELEDTLSQVQEELQAAQTVSGGAKSDAALFSAAPSAEVLTAHEIYEQACRQVVGISTEVTYTNWFGMTSSSAVSGSGFILSQDGYILTNQHVIEDAYKGHLTVTVMLHDGTQYEAEIVGFEDEGSDVAVLKIDATGLSPATLGDSDSMGVGESVYVVGNPLGELAFSMTIGNVSALDRLITTDSDVGSINMFQIDAAVNSGNSGGPVYNARGQVIGVVTAKYSDAGVEGLGFAIPVNDAASIATDLITKGYVTGKAYLGVTIDRRYNSMYSQYYGMPIGAYVESVEKGSCAEKAGLRTGDIITKLGEQSISSYDELKAALRQFSAGETAPLIFYRAGDSLTVNLTFDEALPGAASAMETASRSSAGGGI